MVDASSVVPSRSPGKSVAATELYGIGRHAAQQLARRELAKSMYQASISARILRWLGHLLDDVFRAGASLPGGWWSSVALLAALVVVIAGVLLWIRPATARSGRGGGVLASRLASAADHRALSERHAADGDYSAAIIDCMRAVAAQVEERGLLQARPGRTADEFAAEASKVLPRLMADLGAAALLFDDIRYGERIGTAAGFEQVRKLDSMVSAAKIDPVPVAIPASPAPVR
jgi:hypothetical protein